MFAVELERGKRELGAVVLTNLNLQFRLVLSVFNCSLRSPGLCAAFRDQIAPPQSYTHMYRIQQLTVCFLHLSPALCFNLS